MKTLILFREGLSGHYLKSIIDDSTADIGFRVDPWYPGIYDHSIKSPSNESCICLHPHNILGNLYFTRFEVILTIQVYEKIYHACYNNFYKKYLVENPAKNTKFTNWQNDLVYWYDRTFYNIKEYHALYTSDRANNTCPNIVEFDQILDADYIEQILKTHFNYTMTKNRYRIIQTYRSLQLQHHLPCHGKSMQEIIADLPNQIFNQSPWFASYCIFCFETSNGLQEHDRIWSIDSVSSPIDKTFLLEIQNKYQL